MLEDKVRSGQQIPQEGGSAIANRFRGAYWFETAFLATGLTAMTKDMEYLGIFFTERDYACRRLGS